MPGRPLPEPTEAVTFAAAGLRVVWWEADFIVQRSTPEGWRTVAVIERDAATVRTRAQVRAALRAERNRLLAGGTIVDHRLGQALRWNGTTWQTVSA